jgi:hypothetical protein
VKIVCPNPSTWLVSNSVMFPELLGVEIARAIEDESPLALYAQRSRSRRGSRSRCSPVASRQDGP